MALNNVITNFDALLNNVYLDTSDLSNSICIDTSNNFIGIKNPNPVYELDICGTIQCSNIFLLNRDNDISEFDINYDFNNLRFSKSIYIEENGIFNNKIDVSYISISNDLNVEKNAIIRQRLYVDGDVSLNNNVDISNNLNVSNLIECYDLSINNKLDVSGIHIVNNLTISGQLIIESGLVGVGLNQVPILSDDRIKHNEIDISNAINIVRLLTPQKYQKTYTIKDENYDGSLNEPYILEAGLIAQDIQKIPDLSFCVYRHSDIYSLDYNSIFVYGIQAIKDLDNIIKTENLEVNNNIKNLENKLLDISNNLTVNNNKINEISNNVINLNLLDGNENIAKIISNQQNLINILSNKIVSLENKINNL